jgi:predicted NodU family carbamoyl transferase
MRIIGLSAFYHDSAAAVVEDGRIVAAAQEERFTRKKHDSGFPHHALAYCLDAAATTLDAAITSYSTISHSSSSSDCWRPISSSRRADLVRSAWPSRFGSAKSYSKSSFSGTN